MMDVLHHLDIAELHAPNFDCDFHDSSNGSTATHQDISRGPVPSSQSQNKNPDYRLPPPLWQTPASWYITPIPFGHTSSPQMTKTNLTTKVPNAIQSMGLDW